MTDENTSQVPLGQPAEVDKSVREGAWQVVQQGAQVVGELGGGIGGVAAAVALAKAGKGGGGSPPPQSPPDE